MRIFNRLVMILLLFGLIVLGVYTVAYSLDLLGHRLSDLFNGFSAFRDGVSGLVRDAENGQLGATTVILLVLTAVIGLILLIAELKPPRPRRVRMQEGTFVTRPAVEREVVAAAEATPDVLGSSARVKARRRPGAQVKVDVNVRRGEDLAEIRSILEENIRQRINESGIPLHRLKVNLIESDPRETRRRVR